MLKYAMIVLVSLSLVTCSTTPQALEKDSGTRSATLEFSENYQAVYKRIFDTAKACAETGFLFSPQASMNVDAQLYSELGMGEITYSLLNMSIRNYYWKAKIEKDGAGSKLTIYSGNTLRNAVWLDKIKSWANGSTSC